MKTKEIVLINISGHDKPGLTSSLGGILAAHDIRILDIGQAVVHEALALGMLIEVPERSSFTAIKKDLIVRAHELDIQIRFSVISQQQFDHWAAAQAKERFIITVLGREITAEQLSRVSTIISENDLNIDRIERLSGRLSLATPSSANACVEFRVSGRPHSADDMRAALLALTHELSIDIAFQRESIYRRNRRLFVFDMDSTLIQAEVIDELAKLNGVGDQVAGITEATMRGQLDFKQSFTQRVALLRGLPEVRLQQVLNTIPLAEGAERLISTLKSLGYKTAILSGGFSFFGEYLRARLGIDHVHANQLEVIDGQVTGRVGEEIVDGEGKAQLLRDIAKRENISLDQVVAVGDGANDLPMLNIAGMGIAFHAKPLVRQSANHAVSYLGLDSILYLIGVRDRDLAAIEASG
jgi:phosphoserine phosphatase